MCVWGGGRNGSWPVTVVEVLTRSRSNTVNVFSVTKKDRARRRAEKKNEEKKKRIIIIKYRSTRIIIITTARASYIIILRLYVEESTKRYAYKHMSRGLYEEKKKHFVSCFSLSLFLKPTRLGRFIRIHAMTEHVFIVFDITKIPSIRAPPPHAFVRQIPKTARTGTHRVGLHWTGHVRAGTAEHKSRSAIITLILYYVVVIGQDFYAFLTSFSISPNLSFLS